MRSLRGALCALLIALSGVRAPAAPAAETAPESSATTDQQQGRDELETIVVTGERPGPALWKVTRKDHVLWILPMFGPLPDRLVWRSGEVESVIADSQAIYADALIATERSSDRKVDARLMKALGNGGGKPLWRVMPPALYAQFTLLSRRYAGDSRQFDYFRPYEATDLLREKAMERLTLTSDGGIVATVRALAAGHGVKFFNRRPIERGDWGRIISQLENTPREADVACAQARLERLDTDLRQAVVRANAWARGDIGALRQDADLYNGRGDIAACEQFFGYMKFVRQRTLDLRKRSYQEYVRALKKNRSTLVLAPIGELFDDNGMIARFSADGYGVQAPPEVSE